MVHVSDRSSDYEAQLPNEIDNLIYPRQIFTCSVVVLEIYFPIHRATCAELTSNKSSKIQIEIDI